MTTCTSTLATGEPCNAPALNNHTCCRHHDPNRPHPEARPRSHEYQPLELPPIIDKHGILSAVVEVIHAVSERRIKRSEGGTLLYGLQFAASLMTELDQMAPYSEEVHDSKPAQLPSDPAHSSDPITDSGRPRNKLGAEGRVFFKPTPEDDKELMALFEKGEMDQFTELYMAKHDAWERQQPKPTGPTVPHSSHSLIVR